MIAYTASGVSSCHESVSAEEAIEKLRLGLYVMIREGSVRRDLKAVSRIKDKFKDVQIYVPPAVILGTYVFDDFLDLNDLRKFSLSCENDEKIIEPDKILAQSS